MKGVLTYYYIHYSKEEKKWGTNVRKDSVYKFSKDEASKTYLLWQLMFDIFKYKQHL